MIVIVFVFMTQTNDKEVQVSSHVAAAAAADDDDDDDEEDDDDDVWSVKPVDSTQQMNLELCCLKVSSI